MEEEGGREVERWSECEVGVLNVQCSVFIVQCVVFVCDRTSFFNHNMDASTTTIAIYYAHHIHIKSNTHASTLIHWSWSSCITWV